MKGGELQSFGLVVITQFCQMMKTGRDKDDCPLDMIGRALLLLFVLVE